MSREATIQALEKVGIYAGKLAKAGGLLGMGALAVSALLHTTANVMRSDDESMDEILKRVRRPRTLAMPWAPTPEEDTKRQKRPSKEPPK